jgi:outer membrane protein, multidrug efflux system
MSKRLYAVALLAGAMVGGCKVGPDYQAPEVAVPSNYANGPATQPTTQPVADLATWWKTFNDPMLESLVDRAVESNLDLRVAAARVAEARAARGVVSAGLWPQVNLDGTATKSKPSENSGQFSGIPPSGRSALARERANFQVQTDALWELDVFGGTRRGVEAATADIEAAMEHGRAVMVSLVGEVALNYVQLRGLQRELVITRQNIKAQRDTLDLTQQRFQAGMTSELDPVRTRALVASSEAATPLIEKAIAQTIHRLSVLLAKDPAALGGELSGEGPMPISSAEVPLGLPSELLRRRPDIRASERQLAGATARIGVATADLYPKFTITGALGMQASEYSRLGDIQSGFWSIAPGFSWPVFDAGRIRSMIAVQNARTDAALAIYEMTVLTSLEEVENALVDWSKDRQRKLFLEEEVAASRRSVELATVVYKQGLTDLLSVLDAQKNLFQSELLLVAQELMLSADVVRLYKALGGGWEDCGCRP